MKFCCVAILTMIAFSIDAQSLLQAEVEQDSELIIPFEMKKHFGNRPTIKAQVNGLLLTFELHSNAGFSMQISHQAADTANIADRKHVDSFGIAAIGKVSTLGRDSAFVDRFTIGRKVFTRVAGDRLFVC